MKDKKKKFLLTNFVTMLRAIGVLALFPVYKLLGGAVTGCLNIACFLTDLADGYMARKFKVSSFFGSFLDGAIDKVFLITNLIWLLGITPLAIIPIIFEVLIASTQYLKYQFNFNVKSNKIGKAKMWVAGVTIVFCNFLVDKNFLNFLGANLATKVASLNQIALFGTILTPFILSEMATLASYMREFGKEYQELTPEKIEEKKKQDEELAKEVSEIPLKDFMFENDIYEKYKDSGNLKLIRNLTRKKGK